MTGMLTMKPLYKLDNKGKIRTWYVEIQNDKYRVVSGILDGKLVRAGWTVAVPKNVGRINETTAVEQAIKEAEALYEQQQAQGGYFDDIENINEETYFKPMLAEKYKDYIEKEVQSAFNRGEKVYSSFKLDGFRNCSTLVGMNSRKGKPFFSSPHISFSLIELFMQCPDVILDGELYNHELHDDFNKLQSLITKKKPTPEDLKETQEKVQYHVYDIYLKNEPDATFSRRYEVLSSIAEKFFDGKTIQLVESIPCSSFAEIDKAYEIALENNYEGQILRLDAPYENKRTKKLLKRKEFIDEEFILKDIEEGIGNWAGASKAVLALLPDGREFRAGIKGDYETLKKVLQEKDKYIGGDVTIRYFNLTPDGIPRFGVTTTFYQGKRDI